MVAATSNYVYPQMSGLPASAWKSAWMQEDAIILAAGVMLVLEAFARRAWLQWAAALLNFAMIVIFLARYTMAG